MNRDNAGSIYKFDAMSDKQRQENYFRFQLDVLMKEIDLIDNSIARLDELLLRNRNWGTTLWAGLLAIVLPRTKGFEPIFILAIAVIPLLFWLIDIRWKMALLRCSDRQKEISRFLNSDALINSFETNYISPIELLDPTGADLPADDWSYFVKALHYKDTPIFYPAQILCTLLLFYLAAKYS